MSNSKQPQQNTTEEIARMTSRNHNNREDGDDSEEESPQRDNGTKRKLAIVHNSDSDEEDEAYTIQAYDSDDAMDDDDSQSQLNSSSSSSDSQNSGTEPRCATCHVVLDDENHAEKQSTENHVSEYKKIFVNYDGSVGPVCHVCHLLFCRYQNQSANKRQQQHAKKEESRVTSSKQSLMLLAPSSSSSSSSSTNGPSATTTTTTRRRASSSTSSSSAGSNLVSLSSNFASNSPSTNQNNSPSTTNNQNNTTSNDTDLCVCCDTKITSTRRYNYSSFAEDYSELFPGSENKPGYTVCESCYRKGRRHRKRKEKLSKSKSSKDLGTDQSENNNNNTSKEERKKTTKTTGSKKSDDAQNVNETTTSNSKKTENKSSEKVTNEKAKEVTAEKDGKKKKTGEKSTSEPVSETDTAKQDKKSKSKSDSTIAATSSTGKKDELPPPKPVQNSNNKKESSASAIIVPVPKKIQKRLREERPSPNSMDNYLVKKPRLASSPVSSSIVVLDSPMPSPSTPLRSHLSVSTSAVSPPITPAITTAFPALTSPELVTPATPSSRNIVPSPNQQDQSLNNITAVPPPSVTSHQLPALSTIIASPSNDQSVHLNEADHDIVIDDEAVDIFLELRKLNDNYDEQLYGPEALLPPQYYQSVYMSRVTVSSTLDLVHMKRITQDQVSKLFRGLHVVSVRRVHRDYIGTELQENLTWNNVFKQYPIFPKERFIVYMSKRPLSH